MTFRTLTILFSIMFIVGCDKAPTATAPDKTETAPAAKTAPADDHAAEKSGHAPHDAVAGSHEDWCGGHQVPESLCTRCNSSLVAGFKATGDWCEKHKMPESQCLACNPDLKIVRPPKVKKN